MGGWGGGHSGLPPPGAAGDRLAAVPWGFSRQERAQHRPGAKSLPLVANIYIYIYIWKLPFMSHSFAQTFNYHVS